MINQMVDQAAGAAISTRDRLLEAARYLFWERGYSATSMTDILERAEANSGSFYHFFASKEALMIAVLDSYLGGLEPVVMQPASESHADPIERIFGVLEGYRERLVQTGCRYGCPLGRLALEVDTENRPAHQLIAANFDAWTEWIRKWLEEAKDRLPRDLNLVALSRFVLTTMEGGVMQSRTHRSLEPFDQSVAQLRDYFRRLLAEGRVRRVKTLNKPKRRDK
jgi:TetR/AcrR family transcriptional repressor of nem operon